MFWLYRLADHVIDSGPYVSEPYFDATVLGVVDIFDSVHINPRLNRITDDGTTWRYATSAEVAAFIADAQVAMYRETARHPDRIADLLVLLKLTSPAGQWESLTPAERLAEAFALAEEWVMLRGTI